MSHVVLGAITRVVASERSSQWSTLRLGCLETSGHLVVSSHRHREAVGRVGDVFVFDDLDVVAVVAEEHVAWTADERRQLGPVGVVAWRCRPAPPGANHRHHQSNPDGEEGKRAELKAGIRLATGGHGLQEGEM